MPDDENLLHRTEQLLGGKIATLSGQAPDPNYQGPAPQPIDPATGMHKDYYVLPEEERKKEKVRPVRTSYIHLKCGGKTSMGPMLCETYAVNPKFYSSTYCATCKGHYPVGEDGEFVWDGTNEKVGT